VRILALVAVVLTLSVVPEARDDSDFRFSNAVERAFASGGRVRLDLSAGDHRVRKGGNDRIRVTWHTRTAEQMDEARVRAAVRGNEATVRTWGPNNSFRVDIEMPGRSDLNLRMSAGNLSIAGIEGHKDVRLRAGNLDIEVSDPSQYGQVSASVTAGDLLAQSFGVSTGGLFRSFSRTGLGRFELRARLWAGNLQLLSPE
jgi:hypothetical protein